MGDCKDNMKPSTPAPAAATPAAKTEKSVLGIFGGKRANRVAELEKEVEDLKAKLAEAQKPQVTAGNFASIIEQADNTLNGLIKTKSDDCQNEKGKERENERKLGMLQTMQYMIHGVMNTVDNWNKEFGN